MLGYSSDPGLDPIYCDGLSLPCPSHECSCPDCLATFAVEDDAPEPEPASAEAN